MSGQISYAPPGGDWGTGYCVAITLKNDSSQVITDWTLVVDVGKASIQSLWGGDPTRVGANVTVTQPTYAPDLKPADTAVVGFCGSTPDSSDRPTIVSIVGVTKPDTGAAGAAGAAGASPGGAAGSAGALPGGAAGAPPVDTVTAVLTVNSKWQNGYCTSVDVKNGRKTAINNWSVVMDVGTATITQLWTGTYTKSGSKITVSAMSYNKDVAPGASANFGYCAAFTSAVMPAPAVVSVSAQP